MYSREDHEEEGQPETRLTIRRNTEAETQTLTLILRNRQGETLEIPISEVDVRNRIRPRLTEEFIVCANCQARLPQTTDPTVNHHIAMRHAIEQCDRRADAQDQRTEWLIEWKEQQKKHQLEQLTAAARKKPRGLKSVMRWIRGFFSAA